MLANCDIDLLESENISHSVTIVPRLEYSITLLDEIIGILKKKRENVTKLNNEFANNFDENDKTHIKSIELERIMVFSLEILLEIRKRTGHISGVNSIPKILPSSIHMIRTVSAQLFDIVPNCSRKLSELSVHLGSVALDSAAITTARFDFGQSNKDSTILLDEVKLMADSKISKQYPNLDFFKLWNT